jgi:sodium/potassium-transporting ATPase subunit alpha
MRNLDFARKFVGMPAPKIKPSDSDPLRAIALTGDDLETLGTEDWDMLVGTYGEIVFARVDTGSEALCRRGDQS